MTRTRRPLFALACIAAAVLALGPGMASPGPIDEPSPSATPPPAPGSSDELAALERAPGLVVRPTGYTGSRPTAKGAPHPPILTEIKTPLITRGATIRPTTSNDLS